MGGPQSRGLVLIEVLIAIGVLAFLTLIIYGAMSSMQRSREGVRRINDRFREGRMAMARIERDLSAAYISNHRPIDESITVVNTAFIGTRGTPADRLDFNAFSNIRLDENSRESDQAEISYFGSPDPEHNGVTDLARRINPHLDLEPERGGRVQVLATDIDLFDLEYLDPMTGQWSETWDTTQALDQENRMPLQVRVLLVLNGGKRTGVGRARGTLRFVTKVSIPIMRPLTFATQ